MSPNRARSGRPHLESHQHVFGYLVLAALISGLGPVCPNLIARGRTSLRRELPHGGSSRPLTQTVSWWAVRTTRSLGGTGPYRR
jgi:hypothetical protein